jgi:hypothetical protein
MSIRRIILLLIMLAGNECFAQSIKIKTVKFKDNKLVIGYDLLDSLEGRFYSVRLYSSSDGFLNPLTKIIGDEGLEVKPGHDKTIAWAYKDELSATFEGKISVEVRGRIFLPFVGVSGINQYKMFKRKQKYNLTWTGGAPENILNFDLFHGETRIYTFPNLANVGHYAFEFPSHVRPGKNYRFKVSDTKNKEEVVFTQPFKIKRRVPLLLKAIPILLGGSLIYFLIQSADTKAPPASGLADPPSPGSQGN